MLPHSGDLRQNPLRFPNSKCRKNFSFWRSFILEAVVVIFLMTAISDLTLQPLESAKHLSVDR